MKSLIEHGEPPITPRLYAANRGMTNQRTAAADSLQIKTILVPLDFSAPSAKALRYAQEVARTFGAHLHLVHVCDCDYLPSLEGVALVIPQREAIRRARRHLRAFAATHGLDPKPGHLHVVGGRAYNEICSLAGRLGSDLIVTATRGHTGLKRLLLGSTAQRVVQHAPCPVLIVPTHEHEFLCSSGKGAPVLEVKKILVPLDFSECSLAGLQFAVPLAHFWKARLVFQQYARKQFRSLRRVRRPPSADDRILCT